MLCLTIERSLVQQHREALSTVEQMSRREQVFRKRIEVSLLPGNQAVTCKSANP